MNEKYQTVSQVSFFSSVRASAFLLLVSSFGILDAQITTNVPPMQPQPPVVQVHTLLATPQTAPANPNPPPYTNSGDNTTGFSVRFGNPSIASNGAELVGSPGGGWYAIPVEVSGNFKIEFDVLNDSLDGDSHVLMVDDATNSGIDVRNSPQGTDTPSINIIYGPNLASYNDFYFPGNILSSAGSSAFPNFAWTHVIITKTGGTITDNVGGEILTANVSSLPFPSLARIGFGYYATNYRGGNGILKYRNINVTGGAATEVHIGGPDVPYQNLYVDRTDPTKKASDFVQLPIGTPLYGGDPLGDYVDYKAYIVNYEVYPAVLPQGS